MAKRISIWKKIMSVVAYFLYLFIVIVVFDILILNKFLGFGYPHHYEEENIQRFPAPYVAFTGKPNEADHNEKGFRGPSFIESKPSDLKIAFFGGSTGYGGNPPIARIMEIRLKELLGENVFVSNYSVVSSNHRQHLHGIIEYLPKNKPDLIIFYGGFNETIQSGFYDPRPGYPYNFFYRSETRPFFKLLLENSAIIGEIDKKLGVVSGIKKIRKKQQPFSESWNNRIANKYFETLMLASNVTSTIESTRFGATRFLAFYQPYQVPEYFVSKHNEIKDYISSIKYAYDVSSEYDSLGKEVYRDIVHVNQEAKEIMAHKIADIVAKELLPVEDEAY
ncbi:MAG: hypothetical protein GY834_03175 [Bacteroidetes bacterium]|nr:hypothetical protein [Bacteroidota bacterium]